MQQVNNKNDLQFFRENFTGNYIAELPRNNVLLSVREDPGYPHETHDFIANGLLSLHITISPNYEFQLTDNNKTTICFLIDTVRDGFWFTDFVGQDCQSIATYNQSTLTIKVTPKDPKVQTARQVIYLFYENCDGTKAIMMDVFNGTTWWQIVYTKTEA